MRCHYHPGADATRQCGGCGKPLCAECVGDRPADAPLCHVCQALDAAGDMTRAQAQRRDRADAAVARQKRNRRLRVAAGWMIVALCLGIVLARMPRLIEAFQPERPIRRGTYATDALTDACIGNLWRQSALLRRGMRPDATLKCPASEKPYLVSENSGNTTVACPEPHRHGLAVLRVEKDRPAPMVRK